MSKRAEERALEAYPVKMVSGPIGFEELLKFDFNSLFRCIFTEGYEQAEKDTIERAVAWLKDNAEKYIVQTTESYPDAPFKAIIGGNCWEDLKKAMEDEK